MNATRRSGGLPGTRITRPSWQAFRRITERTYKTVNENATRPGVITRWKEERIHIHTYKITIYLSVFRDGGFILPIYFHIIDVEVGYILELNYIKRAWPVGVAGMLEPGDSVI
ncbi:hypothetical protein I7I48_00446 [Histoplasma ohiense]|nr:hypothetical protein I7I48_00446 [Histoplasma ohiense (nom. inval.)]